MLSEYLEQRYKPNEPIFLSDIDLPVKNNYLRQMMKNLCDAGKIKRFDDGIYYIPSQSRLKGGSSLAPGTVAMYKYIKRNGKTNGYYSGYTFANQMGLTTQVPFTLEIVTNAASAAVREVELNGQKFIIRKPKTEITEENYQTLQLLDLIKDIEKYSDEEIENISGRVMEYIMEIGITQENIDRYISLYPDKIYKNFYEMRLYNAFTS